MVKLASGNGGAKPAVPAAPGLKAKAITPTKAPVDMSKYFASPASESSIMGDILIHGRQKGGKTIIAATASEFAPDVDETGAIVRPKHTVELGDMFWIEFDDGATEGLQELKMVVPPSQRLIFSKLLVDMPAGLAIKRAMELIKEALSNMPHVRFIVNDTVSQLDRDLEAFFVEKTKDDRNQFAPYKLLNAAHKDYHAGLRRTHPQKIHLCHSRALMDSDNKDQVNNRKANFITNDAIVPEITGKSRTVYLGNSSLELVAEFIPEPGKDRRRGKRLLHPYGGAGFEGSNRFHQSLDFDEPPHLRKLLNKIEAARK